MRFNAWYICIGLISAGLIFASNAGIINLLHGPQTVWGYEITALTCITLGTAFGAMIYHRETKLGLRSKEGP